MEKAKELLVEWLKNEKILGEEEIEVISSESKISSTEVCPRQEKEVETTNSKLQITDKRISSKKERLLEFSKSVIGCRKCRLYEGRKHLVFGEGDPDAKLVFMGEAPGMQEDLTGHPFVGEAGKLLTKLIGSIGLHREEIYIANILKCRPPGNRDPKPDEVEQCRPWLLEQIDIISPKVICCLGRWATWGLLGSEKVNPQDAFSKIRGKVYEWEGVKVVPTYHPAALLYHPAWKEVVERDLKLVKELI